MALWFVLLPHSKNYSGSSPSQQHLCVEFTCCLHVEFSAHLMTAPGCCGGYLGLTDYCVDWFIDWCTCCPPSCVDSSTEAIPDVCVVSEQV